MKFIIFDIEVFAYDWVTVFKEVGSKTRTVFHNDNEGLHEYMTQDELQPCPFCGEEAEFEDDPEGYRVICSVCGAFLGSFTEKKNAIKAWNTRTDD